MNVLMPSLLAAVAGIVAVRSWTRDDLLERFEGPKGAPAPEARWTGLRRFLHPAAALLATVVAWRLLGPAVGILAAVATACVPVAVRRRRRSRVVERAEEQLADGVSSIGAALRAGMSLSQAVRFASNEVEPPLADDLRSVVDREAMGMPLARSLDRWTDGIDSPDFRLTSSVLQLHRRTGGDLPLVLDRLASTLSERIATAREARSLTAQARLSGAILGFLPVGFFLFLSVLSPKEMSAAYHSPAGVAAIVTGLALQGVAFLWIRHLLKVAT